MFTLVFDTETTGLPGKGNPPLEKQPWVTQLACILYRDVDKWPVAHFSTYLNPSHGEKKGTIPNEKFFIENKLTPEFISGSWMETENSLKIFNHYLRRATRLVAHNMAFDLGRMRDSYSRVLGGPNEIFEALPKFCTMESLTDVLRLPAKWGSCFKWPNLAESYSALVNPEGFADAHDAMNDVSACAAVLFKIEERGIPLHQVY